MKASAVVTGLPRNPAHPPPWDVTIGLYGGVTSVAVLSAVGVSQQNLAAAPWRTAKAHLLATVTATVDFLAAAIFGHGGYVDRELTGGALTLTLIGFAVLTIGGWLRGTVVFVHAMRVVNGRDVKASDAACLQRAQTVPSVRRSPVVSRATETSGGSR